LRCSACACAPAAGARCAPGDEENMAKSKWIYPYMGHGIPQVTHLVTATGHRPIGPQNTYEVLGYRRGPLTPLTPTLPPPPDHLGPGLSPQPTAQHGPRSQAWASGSGPLTGMQGSRNPKGAGNAGAAVLCATPCFFLLSCVCGVWAYNTTPHAPPAAAERGTRGCVAAYTEHRGESELRIRTAWRMITHVGGTEHQGVGC
jgi:hypothetical protein